jgi:ribosome-associated protein
MLIVNERILIPDEEFDWSYARSGGPGGQNVNKVSSKAVLRWKPASPSIPEDVRARFLHKFANRITTEGDLVMSSERYRDQERNRQDCLEKLTAMLLEVALPPRPRKITRPSKGSKARRLANKRHTAKTKATRRRPSMDD